MLTGRGSTPKELDPLLSVDAMEGCRILPMTEADTVLGGIEAEPSFTVWPLELLCKLGGP